MTENPSYFPLRWESTGDKWWYASPIDCAAANGHYELVRQLLRLDPNHLISLTSLRRLRRLESLWDDSGDSRPALSRSSVARRLLRESEISPRNRLLGAGYGGWLLYTAASAGDLDFVKELLARDPLLVFGEGEYGLTDILYAAARSGSPEVFWILYDFAVSPRFDRDGGRGDGCEIPAGFKWEVVNRAVHAAARGGNLAVLAELLGGGGESGGGVLSYRDAYGSTVLHAAAGRGQFQVVKHLITTYDEIISSTDNEGNTALHIAAYKGQLSVVQLLLNASPSSISTTNKDGNTLLHMAVAGTLSPGFRRVDRQIELVKELITTKNNFKLEEIVNFKNAEGRTALHMAIFGNVHSDLVQYLMEARCINVNIRDDHNLTPLDYLRQQPRSSSSEMLIRQLILAGGMSNCQDYSARKAFATHLRMQGAECSSPGTTFRVLDSEIFKHSGIEHMFSGSRVDHRGVTIRHVTTPSEISHCGSNGGEEEQEQVHVESKKRRGPVQNAAKRLKTMFDWTMTKKKRQSIDDDAPIPLRERFSGPTSLSSSNKRTLAVRSNVSSPTNRKKSASGLVVQGALQAPRQRSSSSSLSKISISSQSSLDKGKGSLFSAQDEAEENPRLMHKQGLANKKLLVNQYLCFGGSGLSMKNPVGRHQREPSNGNKQPMQTVACH